MDKDRIEGAMDKAKGTAKSTAGGVKDAVREKTGA